VEISDQTLGYRAKAARVGEIALTIFLDVRETKDFSQISVQCSTVHITEPSIHVTLQAMALTFNLGRVLAENVRFIVPEPIGVLFDSDVGRVRTFAHVDHCVPFSALMPL
jgi:hypothetical protein